MSQVWVFYYGAFMSPDVLIEHGVTPGRIMPARLNGFELSMRPRGNLMRSDRWCVYGAMIEVTHADLAKLYSSLEELFGLKYSPEPVLAESFDGAVRPALCYIAPHMDDAPPTIEYVDQLVEAARRVGLPEWYVEFVESFRSEKRGKD